MSKTDDIENALENNPELKQEVEREGQNLRDAGVTHSADDNTPPNNANDAITSDDSKPELYRSLESDVGNMNGKQPSGSEHQQQVEINEPSAPEGNSGQAASMEIPDSVKEQAASIMESQNIQQASTPTGEIGELSPSQTPAPSKVESIDATPPNASDSTEREESSKVDDIAAGKLSHVEKEEQRREADKDGPTIER